MNARTLTIHADELEYTPEGLRTLTSLPLEVGAFNQLVLIRPTPVRAVPVGRGGFTSDSAFPTPAALFGLLNPSLQSLLDPEGEPIYQLYGHAQADGSEAHNKALSERRARAMQAMLVGDVDDVDAIAEHESWGLLEHQVMLRMLRCDPGPIDGEAGPLTSVGVRNFQEDYLDGVFHRHAEQPPRDPALVPDGDLGPKTAAALVDAYVHACSPFVDPGQLHPTHPAVGCSEFNPLPGEEPLSAANRRVSLVVHSNLPDFHDRAPCTEGDHGACPVDHEPQRCLWYRSHVDDQSLEHPHLHVDLRWLPLPDGRVLLTAVTSLADGDEVEFRVFRSGPVEGPQDVREDNLREPLSDVIPGTVTMGIAQAIWTPEEGLDPFDFDEWYVPLDYEAVVRDPVMGWSQGDGVCPPLFTVRGGGATALSEPPGQDLHRIRFVFEDGADAREGKAAWGIDNYGRTVHVDLDGRRAHTDVRATQEEVRVMHLEPIDYRPRPRSTS